MSYNKSSQDNKEHASMKSVPKKGKPTCLDLTGYDTTNNVVI